MDKGNLPEKPELGKACNGCGYCCIQEPCRIANEFLNCHEGPCVALEYENNRTFCGMVRRPIHYLMGKTAPENLTGALQVQLASMLWIGAGCDSQ